MQTISPKTREYLARYAVFIILAILLALLIIGMTRTFYSDFFLKKEISRRESELKEVEKRRIESLEFLKTIQKESFIEKEAREKLGLARSGEHKVIFASSSGVFENPPIQNALLGLTNPKKWWYYFFAPKNLAPEKAPSIAPKSAP